MRTASILVGCKGPAAPRRVRLVAPCWIPILAAGMIAMIGAAEPVRPSDVEAVAEIRQVLLGLALQVGEVVLHLLQQLLQSRLALNVERWIERPGQRAQLQLEQL